MLRKILIGSIFGSIFISSYVFFKSPFEAYASYLVFLVFFPIFFVKFGIPKWPVLLFLPLLISGLTYCAIGLNTYSLFFKIFIGFFSSVLFYHYVIQLFQFDLRLLFKYYMKGAYIVTVIGIIQIVSYLVGFTPGYDFHWIFNKWSLAPGGLGIRMNSIFSEPAYFAAVIAPAFFVSVYNLFRREEYFINRFQSIVIAGAYFLTFSSIGILAIFAAIVLFLINLGFVKYSFFMIPLLFIFFNYAYKNVPEFTERYDGTIEIFSSGNYKSWDIHGSSFVLYNNYHVALENFKRNPIMGTGLGSHPIAFDKYSYTNLVGAVTIDFNKVDANSMLLRLMSETGLYGLTLVLFMLFKCWVYKGNSVQDDTWLMSNAISLVIILYLLRQGHYFLNGFPFFLWMYYYLAKEHWGELRELAENKKEEYVIPEPTPALVPDRRTW